MDIKSDFQSILKQDKQWSERLRLDTLPKPVRRDATWLAHSGDSWLWWLVLALVWLFGNVFWKQWAVTVIVGLAILGVIMFAIKRLVKRDRPVGLWGMRMRKHDPNSFPSGHASRSFMLALLAAGLGPAWLAILLWVWAPLVSLARVAVGVHYLSDTVGGLLLAILVGLLWLHFHEGVLQFVFSASLRLVHLPLW